MFYYEARRKQLYYFIDKIIEYLNSLHIDSNTLGFTIILFHYLLVISIVIYLIFGKENKYYYVSLFLFLFSIFSNLYFNCCPILKIERILINEPNWAGLYEVLRFLNINPNTQNIQITFWSLCLIVITTVAFKKYLKLIKNNK